MAYGLIHRMALKINISIQDKGAKLIPITGAKKLDSFYYRPSKIEYIKEHDLPTEPKHFYISKIIINN
jgi:hypothetical protein